VGEGTEGEDDGDFHEVDVDEEDVDDFPADDEAGLGVEGQQAEEGFGVGAVGVLAEFREVGGYFAVQSVNILDYLWGGGEAVWYRVSTTAKQRLHEFIPLLHLYYYNTRVVIKIPAGSECSLKD
jgi:hypothetical protein